MLRTALRDPDLRVGYRAAGAPDLVSVGGAPLAVGDSMRVPVLAGGHEIGALVRGSVGFA